MGVQWQKFSTQVDADKLERLRILAERDGKQLRAVFDEAISEYLDERNGKPGLDPELQALYDEFTEQFDSTLTELAK